MQKMKESYITKDFRETAEVQFPSKVKELKDSFNRRLGELLDENADASKKEMFHLGRQILPGIAAYETLQQVMSEEEALETVHSYVEKLVIKSHKRLVSILRIPGLYRLVPRVFMKSTRSVFGAEAGFASNEIQTGSGVWRIDMIKCPYHDITLKYGVPELCRCFCDSDDISYSGLHPKLIWERTKTLGRGNDCCDFCMKIRKNLNEISRE